MSDSQLEDLDAFRDRARTWIRANLGPMGSSARSLRNELNDQEELAAVARERDVQRMLFDAGLAGLCFPRDYGGQG